MEPKTARELSRLRGRIAKLDRERDALAARRDALVRIALADGASLREAGAASGLSHGAVAKIRDRQVAGRS